jgi:phenylacetate-CoA ligase
MTSVRSIQYIQGWLSALFAYPVAEHLEKRVIRSKRAELRAYYQQAFAIRRELARNRLVGMLTFAGERVPYYQDLFKQHRFEPVKVERDVRYLQDLPFLTKDLIREQGARLLSRPLADVKHSDMKTGGSTGLSCHIFYDQEGADYAAATTLYARECVGKTKNRFELHFACRFPDSPPASKKWTREDWKGLAMNRTNIFFDRLDTVGLEEMWRTLLERRPYLIHGHPSTIYALACYIEQAYGSGHAFEIFESSGELLEPYMRETITRALKCKVVNRYGLAEFGVIGYELKGPAAGMQVLDSEGWAESYAFSENELGEPDGAHELVFTGFRNMLMPLIRYRTGDLARVIPQPDGLYLTEVTGRIHDLVPINGIPHPTHHIMDMLDHRVGSIQEFQIDLRTQPPTLRIVPEAAADLDQIRSKINDYWGQSFIVEFVGHDDFSRVGRHQKFRHVVHP